jgi:hypothetical protein
MTLPTPGKKLSTTMSLPMLKMDEMADPRNVLPLPASICAIQSLQSK